MEIKFEGEFKSLSSFTSEPLSDFTVITGENGSGKSQLIGLIKDKDQPHNPWSLELNPKIGSIQFENLEISNFAQMNNEVYKKKIDNHFKEYQRERPNAKKLIEFLITRNIWKHDVITRDQYARGILKPVKDVSKEEILNLIIQYILEKIPESKTYSESAFLLAFERDEFQCGEKVARLALKVSNYTNKPFDSLEQIDFYNTDLKIHDVEDPHLFHSQVEYAFYHYLKRRESNSIQMYRKERHDAKNESISEGEFDQNNPTPWEQLNDIFRTHEMGFHFKDISINEFNSNLDIRFDLIKTSINEPVSFHDLSSGEKIIMGLIIKLFISQYYTENLRLPELVILDEPDAHLHPQMSKLLIDVLHETFVKKLKIKVIMTTHSPSTIALCPEDSIYQLTNHPETSLKKIDKDTALDILTGFLPTLSINYKNHKQVFVESPTDAYFYRTVFDKLFEQRKYPFRLYFISNAMGEGNCDQVKSVVKSLREFGNNTSYGIIDWDLKNKTSDFVKVHGLDERYSVENFVLDPLYMAILFMSIRSENVYTKINRAETYNYLAIHEEPEEFLQSVVDWYFGEYYKKYPISDQKIESKPIEYLNGKKVMVPKWYLEANGHNTQTKLEKIFPSLEKFKKQGEGVLQKELTLIMARCHQLIPMASVKVIEEIIYPEVKN